MKIRTGFVSNSSSSSFVVAFDRTPSSVDELQKLLFGDTDSYPNPYYDPNYNKEQGWTAKEVAETVWEDIEGKKPLTKKQVKQEFNSGYIDGEPGCDYSRVRPEWKEECRRYFDELHKKRDEFGIQKAEEFMSQNPGAVFYGFSYSDNDGPYHSALEHGTLFHKLPHFKISHH